MLRYRKGRNYFVMDLRSGKNLLTFQPYAQTAKFDLPQAEQDFPLVVFAYQPEAFDKLKWLFCYREKFDVPPRIIIAWQGTSRFKACLRMESSCFPVADLAKSFGMDFILERQLKNAHVVVASEALVRIVHADLFADAFLSSDLGVCRLHLREEGSAHYLPDYKSGTCISTEAEIICPRKS